MVAGSHIAWIMPTASAFLQQSTLGEAFAKQILRSGFAFGLGEPYTSPGRTNFPWKSMSRKDSMRGKFASRQTGPICHSLGFSKLSRAVSEDSSPGPQCFEQTPLSHLVMEPDRRSLQAETDLPGATLVGGRVSSKIRA